LAVCSFSCRIHSWLICTFNPSVMLEFKFQQWPRMEEF
jgi:hypothetical protein